MGELQSAIVAAHVPVMMDIGAQVPDHIPVAPDLRLIFPNLPFRRVSPAIQHQPVPVLLELPLVTLQLALIGAEIDCAARLR